MLDPTAPTPKPGKPGMFSLPHNPTDEQIARARLRTLRTVWAVVLGMGVIVVFLAASIGILHRSLDDARQDSAEAKQAAEKSTEEILIGRENGYKTRALLCTQLILEGIDVRTQEPCTDEGIYKYLNIQAIENVRYEQLRELCEIVQGLGATQIPDSCLPVLNSDPPVTTEP